MTDGVAVPQDQHAHPATWGTQCGVPSPRVLLDTNVWIYIVEADGVEVLRRVARTKGVQVVACPAVVYELLRVPDSVARRRRAKAIAREDWLRLMPEAFSLGVSHFPAE